MADLHKAVALAIDALERIGCQGQSCFCNGPTLEPEPMVTCFACHTLASLRVAIGRPPRLPDELTWQEQYDRDMAGYMARATGRR